MPQLIVGALLDDGGREVARVLTALVVLILLALLLAVAAPAILLISPGALVGSASTTGDIRQASGFVVQQPTGSTTVADTTTDSPRMNTNPVSSLGSAPVAAANRYLGVPYVFGGTNPAVGLDCSGLVQLVFGQLGISLPRTAQQQYNATTRVARDQLQPGDLVFFARTYDDPNDWVTHVGIYVGDGKQINAPTTGQVVSIQPVFSGFWGAHYAGAGRVAA